MPLGQPRVPMVPGRPYKYTGMAGATQVEHKVALCAESPKVLILVSKIGSVLHLEASWRTLALRANAVIQVSSPLQSSTRVQELP